MRDFRDITSEELLRITQECIAIPNLRIGIRRLTAEKIQVGYYFVGERELDSNDKKLLRSYKETFDRLGEREIPLTSLELELVGERTVQILSVERNQGEEFRRIGARVIGSLPGLLLLIKRKYLTATPNNDQLIPYYQKLGFRLCRDGTDEETEEISKDYKKLIVIGREEFDCRKGYLMYKII